MEDSFVGRNRVSNWDFQTKNRNAKPKIMRKVRIFWSRSGKNRTEQHHSFYCNLNANLWG